MAKELTTANFKQEIASGYTLVDFWAPWCRPCVMIADSITELSNEWEGKVNVGKLNVDENTEIQQQYGIMSIPTLILFKDGEVVDKMVGTPPNPTQIIRQFVEMNVEEDSMPKAA